jgi:hypothetical protein
MEIMGLVVAFCIFILLLFYVKPKTESKADGSSDAKEEVIIELENLPMEISGYYYRGGLRILKRIAMLLIVLSVCFTIVEFLIVFFGPDEVWVSRAGMTFSEFMLVYPGPLISVGFITTWGLFQLHSKLVIASLDAPFVFLERHVNLVYPHSCSLDVQITVKYLGKGKWRIDRVNDTKEHGTQKEFEPDSLE